MHQCDGKRRHKSPYVSRKNAEAASSSGRLRNILRSFPNYRSLSSSGLKSLISGGSSMSFFL